MHAPEEVAGSGSGSGTTLFRAGFGRGSSSQKTFLNTFKSLYKGMLIIFNIRKS